MPTISLRFKNNTIGTYDLQPGQSLTIGRLDDNDIVIENLAVSGRHAKIDTVGEGYLLTDLQSKNGCFVNEKLVASHWLNHGDKVSIGKHILEFAFNSGEPRPPAPATDQRDQTMVMDTGNYRDMLSKSGVAGRLASEVGKPVGVLSYLAGGEGEFGLAAIPAREEEARAAIDQVQGPLLLATLESRGLSGALVPIGQNGADTTWASADEVAVIMRGGVVRGTRGLGEDLMSAAIPDESALRRDGGSGQRAYYHLDGDDQTVRRSYSCTSHAQGAASLVIVERPYRATRFEERCRGDDGGFTNEYWFLADGRLIQSRQWIGPSVGFLRLQRLKP